MSSQHLASPPGAELSNGARSTPRFETQLSERAAGAGWLSFAGVMISIAGVLNIIWGIAALANSKFFAANATYVLSNLHTWGWVALILGALQLGAAVSIWSGGQYGRWFGIVVASLSAVAVLMSMPAYPLWALCIFAVDVLIIYGLVAYGGQGEPA